MLDYKNIGVLVSLNTLNMVLNIAYSMAMAHLYGTTAEAAAFFSASILGTSISRFVQTGQLVEVITSKYHKTKAEDGPQAAMSIVSVMCNYMAGIAFVVVLVFIFSGDFFVHQLVPGFDPSLRNYILKIFCITGFLMPFQIATNLFQGMLNAENIYGKVELTNTVSLVITLLILFIFGHAGNVWALVASLCISVLMQFATTVYYLKQVGYRHRFWLQSPYFAFKEILQAVSSTSAYMIGVQLFTFIFNAALSHLSVSVFAVYRYAELIYGKVSNVFMSPVSIVFFNEVNRYITQNNDALVKGFVRKNLNFSYLIGFVVLLPFWAGGVYFIWTLWGGVKFNANDVKAVYELLCLFFASMLVMNPYLIFRKLAVSVIKPDILYYLWAVMHLVSGGLGYGLLSWWGFKGLLIHVFLHNTLMALVPVLTVYFIKREFFAIYDFKEIVKITFSLGIGMLAGWTVGQLWLPYTHYNRMPSLVISGTLAGVSLFAFIGAMLLFKVNEIDIIRTKIFSKLRTKM